MKPARTAVALLALALVAGAAGCSDDKTDQAATPAAQGPGGSTETISTPSGTPTATDTPAASRTMGAAAENAADADVSFTRCAPGASGVAMQAKVTNRTKETRTFILTGLAYDQHKKNVASAALMVNGLKPGATATATGTSSTPAKGTLTCEVSKISSMPM